MNKVPTISSRILDPVFDRKNQRAEYRFPANTLFQSDLRLINIGISSSYAEDEPLPTLGALAAIKSITLMDGSQQLDALNFATLWNSFRNCCQSNNDNASLRRFLTFVKTGYVTSGQYDSEANQTKLDEPKINPQAPFNYAGVANLIGTQECWISLKDMLPFLRSSLYLPTNVFKQLRVVVEYNSSAEMTNLTQVSTAVKTTTQDSLLLCEEVGDSEFKDMVMKTYKGVVYRPIEHEQVSVPSIDGLTEAGTQTKEEVNNYLLSGFNAKKLMRMTVIQQPTYCIKDAANIQGYGEMASLAAYKSAFQVRVNGVNVLAGQGMSGSPTGSYANRRLAYLNDAWGVSNITMGQNVSGLPRVDNLGNTDWVAQQDYIGLNVAARIAELQINYSRVGVADSTAAPEGNQATTMALNLHVFGEVEKALVMNKNGTYNILYT